MSRPLQQTPRRPRRKVPSVWRSQTLREAVAETVDPIRDCLGRLAAKSENACTSSISRTLRTRFLDSIGINIEKVGEGIVEEPIERSEKHASDASELCN